MRRGEERVLNTDIRSHVYGARWTLMELPRPADALNPHHSHICAVSTQSLVGGSPKSRRAYPTLMCSIVDNQHEPTTPNDDNHVNNNNAVAASTVTKAELTNHHKDRGAQLLLGSRSACTCCCEQALPQQSCVPCIHCYLFGTGTTGKSDAWGVVLLATIALGVASVSPTTQQKSSANQRSNTHQNRDHDGSRDS